MNPQISYRWTRLTVAAFCFLTLIFKPTANASQKGSIARGRMLYRDPRAFGVLDSARSVSEPRNLVHRSENFEWRRNLADSTSGLCPLDLSDLSDVRFAIVDSCTKSSPSPDSANNTWPPPFRDPCCNIVLTAYAILQAEWTRKSGYFRVENETVLRACVTEYLQGIAEFGMDLQFEICFSDSFYEYSNRVPSLCGPVTVGDYEALVDEATREGVRSSCSGDLLETQTCGVCSSLSHQMYVQLSEIASKNNATLNEPDPNVSDLSSAKIYDCGYDTVTYISAELVPNGPSDPGTQSCLYIMPLAPTSDASTDLGLIIGLSVAGVVIFSLLSCLVCVWLWKKGGLARLHILPIGNGKLGSSGPRARVVLFDYQEIKDATDNFSADNHIGSGGFGRVYKGVMPDGTVIAVKNLKDSSNKGEAEFVNEVEVINRVRHRNLVRLRGCCVVTSSLDEGHERFLVYDFLPGGSLNDHLFGSEKSAGLTWAQRSRIAVDIARGLAYLHNDTSPPIFHRDIKASNVLLNNEFHACLADFGLAKLTMEGQSHMTASTVAGTHGYMAPEYAMYGKLTGKSDVYSFGVVLLEIMSGRKALDTSQIATPRFLINDWCWTVLESEGSVKGVIDERIRDNSDFQLLTVQERFVITGMLCSHSHDATRPTMADALKYLEGDLPVPSLPSTPTPLYAESSTFKTFLDDSTTGSMGTVTGSFSSVLAGRAEPR